MLMIGITPKVEAGFCPSELTASSRSVTFQAERDVRTIDLQKIQKVIEQKMVRERLEQLGFSQEEIQARLSQADDQQIHQLALKLDELEVGGNGLETVLLVLIIAILVVILLHLTGHKVIVTQR